MALRECTRRFPVLALLLAGACRAALPPASPQPVFFIQMSDPQFGMFTANKDFAQETINFERAITAANRLRPAFVVVTGDLTNREGDAAQIAEYRRIASHLDRAIPLYSVAGNHDVGLPTTAANLAAYRKAYGPDWYTFERGGVYGIVLNSSLIKEPAGSPTDRGAQDAWLRETLDGAKRAGKRNVIVFQHHPWFLSMPDEKDQYFNLPDSTRRSYLDVLQRAGVRHVFAGHYHRNAFGTDGALQMIITGPVSNPLRPDPSGIRIVVLDGERVSHRYYALDSIPARVTTVVP